MRFLALTVLTLAGVVAAATNGFSQKQEPGIGFPFLAAERAAGQKLFDSHCASCHASKRQVFGPSLNGVVGRQAGSVAGFPYSDALKKSGVVWTEENLLRWLADPKGMIPQELMPHVAFSDPAERVYVVEYLKSLKAR
ncbi:MAG TPA: c-type cytochrome [Stellaceae bacterium]|nr:c-type cytochrome [Stellaceae bacterium]